MEKIIGVIDLKAFYAYVECVDRKVNPFTTPLAVVDTERGEGTIVLSVSPYLKSLGVPSRCRFRDIPKDIKGIIYATPRMQHYIDKSSEVMSIVLDYFGEDDIHIYSIDEVFVNIGPYLKMYGKTPVELIKTIQNDILNKTGLMCTAGIAENMFLAKCALDLDGKKAPPYISEWHKEDIENKLWKVTPLSEIWGISTAYEYRLNQLGIMTVGQLAHYPKGILKDKFGIMGEQLWEHANGIDDTDIRNKYIPQENSLSLGQVLIRDYTKTEARLILKEMNIDLANHMRNLNLQCEVVSLTVLYSKSCKESSGFSHQSKLPYLTNDTEILFTHLSTIYDKHIKDYPIRNLYISYGKISNNSGTQFNLFEKPEVTLARANLQKAEDKIKKMYGKDSILRASSLLDESTAKMRHSLIGGHKK